MVFLDGHVELLSHTDIWSPKEDVMPYGDTWKMN